MRAQRIGRFAAALAVAAASVSLIGQGSGQAPVTYDRLLKSDQEPGNWLMYSGTYNSWRYSRLDQINTGNVQRLKPKWLFQLRTRQQVETTPLVVDGIMYVTRPQND